MGARVHAIVVDVSDRGRAERFWCELLGLEVLDRIDQYSFLSEVAPGVRLVLQIVGDPKTSKNRVHVDLEASSHDDLVRSIIHLGGSILGEVREPGYALTVAADPDGNELCVSREPSSAVGDTRSPV